MSKEKQIEEIFNDMIEADHRFQEYCLVNTCHDCEYYGDGECDNHIRAEYLYNASYRKQSEGERNYKALYEQLLEDFEHALYYAGKNNNVCNFCEYDCGEGGVCKGRDSFIYCTPKWRGVKKIIPDCEAPKGGAE